MQRRTFIKTGLSGSALIAALPVSKLVSTTESDITTCTNAESAVHPKRLLKHLARTYGGEFGNVSIKE